MQVRLDAAVVMSVGAYRGAYVVLKVAEDKMPPRLPRPTSRPYVAAREFSLRLLLLCHEWTGQLGI